MVLGGGKREFPTQSHVQRQARCDLVIILGVSIQRAIPNFAGKISAALQKDHWIARKIIGKTVVVEEVLIGGDAGEYKKAIGGDALQCIDLVAPVAAAKFEFVAAVHPTQRARDIEC